MVWLAGMALALLLTGCGFYLKGHKTLPPELSEVYLQVPGDGAIQSRLEESLRTLLVRRGAKVSFDPVTKGRLTVYTLYEDVEPLTIGTSGFAIEYEIETIIEFDYTVAGKLLVPRQTLSILRDYNFNNTTVLATESERRRLQREMQEELAELILLRIDAELTSNPEGPAAEPAG